MKLAIIGSRSVKEEQMVWEAIHTFVTKHSVEGVPITIISGGAEGKQIIDNADRVLAIWDGVSKGTEHGIKYSQKTGKQVMVIKRNIT